MDYFVAIKNAIFESQQETWKELYEVLVSEKSRVLTTLHDIQTLKYK